MDKAALRLLDDQIDKNDFKRIKERVAKESVQYNQQIADLKAADSGFQEYCRYGFSLLSNMRYYYSEANIENKQKMLGLIFPEKLVFDKNSFQTMQPNDVLTLLCNVDNGFSDSINGKSSQKAASSFFVTALGFKPKTFSSVVRCSIQLSYAAIPLSGLQM